MTDCLSKDRTPSTGSDFDLAGRRVFVAGHRGMVGSAVARRLASEPCEVLTAPRSELDLTDRDAVDAWFARERPDVVVLAAAKVGGILANQRLPADFLQDNLDIQSNVLRAAWQTGAAKLLFLGSSCIYPRLAPQPIPEEALLTGPLEQTNEAYAIAKIAGLKLCQAYRTQHGADFISAMPTNLFGPGDNYHPEESHVVAALIRKIHLAKTEGRGEVEIWGSGEPLREFLFVDDLADACLFLLKRYSGLLPLNVGVGKDMSISDLARRIAAVVGWSGRLVYNRAYPDGTPRKLLDVSRLTELGWTASTDLDTGLSRAYADFRARAEG